MEKHQRPKGADHAAANLTAELFDEYSSPFPVLLLTFTTYPTPTLQEDRARHVEQLKKKLKSADDPAAGGEEPEELSGGGAAAGSDEEDETAAKTCVGRSG